MKASLKNVMESAHSGEWIIETIKETRRGGSYYVKAKTRFFRGFEHQNRFDGYFSKSYLNRLCREYFGKNINEMNAHTY